MTCAIFTSARSTCQKTTVNCNDQLIACSLFTFSLKILAAEIQKEMDGSDDLIFVRSLYVSLSQCLDTSVSQ